MNVNVENLLSEWREIHKTNYLDCQNSVPGTDMRVSPFIIEKAKRMEEVARLLLPHLEDMDISASEKYEIKESLN